MSIVNKQIFFNNSICVYSYKSLYKELCPKLSANLFSTDTTDVYGVCMEFNISKIAYIIGYTLN